MVGLMCIHWLMVFIDLLLFRWWSLRRYRGVGHSCFLAYYSCLASCNNFVIFHFTCISQSVIKYLRIYKIRGFVMADTKSCHSDRTHISQRFHLKLPYNNLIPSAFSKLSRPSCLLLNNICESFICTFLNSFCIRVWRVIVLSMTETTLVFFFVFESKSYTYRVF